MNYALQRVRVLARVLDEVIAIQQRSSLSIVGSNQDIGNVLNEAERQLEKLLLEELR